MNQGDAAKNVGQAKGATGRTDEGSVRAGSERGQSVERLERPMDYYTLPADLVSAIVDYLMTRHPMPTELLERLEAAMEPRGFYCVRCGKWHGQMSRFMADGPCKGCGNSYSATGGTMRERNLMLEARRHA